jgi:hypothetical protein
VQRIGHMKTLDLGTGMRHYLHSLSVCQTGGVIVSTPLEITRPVEMRSIGMGVGVFRTSSRVRIVDMRHAPITSTISVVVCLRVTIILIRREAGMEIHTPVWVRETFRIGVCSTLGVSNILGVCNFLVLDRGDFHMRVCSTPGVRSVLVGV